MFGADAIRCTSRHYVGWNPATVFDLGAFGGWYDPSDLSTMWEDLDGNVPASVGSAIARLDDKSGNGLHLTQSVSASRPILKESSGVFYLDFDGIDDFMTRSIPARTVTSFLVCTAVRENERKNSSLYGFSYPSTYVSKFVASAPNANGGYVFDWYNTAHRISGTWPIGVGGGAVVTHYRSGSTISVRANSTQLGQVNTTRSVSVVVCRIGQDAQTNTHYSGRVYGFVFFFSDQSEYIEELENYLGVKMGLEMRK